MAKMLMKAQMGKALKFLNTAAKDVAKAKPVKELTEFQKARLASGKSVGGNLAEQKAKRELTKSIKESSEKVKPKFTEIRNLKKGGQIKSKKK